MTENSIEFMTDHIPEPGELYEIADGVLWVRMPLPYQLDHINLWLIEDDDGWTLVDAGINNTQTMDIWRDIFGRLLKDKKLNRLICTHGHPDHMGLAGWICREWDAELVTSFGEWAWGRILSLGGTNEPDVYSKFYHRAGCNKTQIDYISHHVLSVKELYTLVPQAFHHIRDGEIIDIGGKDWQVIVGRGHSFEHVCLYCESLDVLIAGDQILPKITPNILLHGHDAKSDPLREFIESIESFRHLPETVKVLPSHNRPFIGLHTRLDEYDVHHEERLEDAFRACNGGTTGLEIAQKLFDRELDRHQLFFALGEALSHIRMLETEGRITRSEREDGTLIFAPV